MRLIANKPCSFNGRKFFIGDEIPEDIVSDAKLQEKIGLITIVNDGTSGEETDPQEQQGEILFGIPVVSKNGDDTAAVTRVLMSEEDIQLVFAIMQMNAEEGIKAIAEVASENVLILLLAADSRKTVKEAAQKRAGNLSSTEDVSNESADVGESTGTTTEGTDT